MQEPEVRKYFATRETRKVLQVPQVMSGRVSVAQAGRYALLSQWGDYQDIMLAEPKR